VGYVGAGTVEFLVDHEERFYFMEMNTRLQVEHPVTEMITGLDLVEWQIRVAAGEPLPLKQNDLTMRGHSIEARIYAEDPKHDFLPSIGKLAHLRFPAVTEHVRIDTGVEQGDSITPFYDPMIAKLIVWEETRELAVQRMASALRSCQIVGVANNIGFVERLVTSPSFTAPRLDTSLIEREQEWIASADSEPDYEAFAIAALALLLRERGDARAGGSGSPWAVTDGWRVSGSYVRTLTFAHADKSIDISVAYDRLAYRMTVGGSAFDVAGAFENDGSLSASIGPNHVRANVIEYHGQLYVFTADKRFVFTHVDPLDVETEHNVGESSFLAPMPGRVVALAVEPGEKVQKGAALMILEAMKMECTIYAPASGSVEAFHFSVGDPVSEGAPLLSFNRDEASEH
jgi:3-methylcrotonyl-CoA carboxylase alpha subunit